MEELCTACMCSDRKLYFVTDAGFYDVYSQILKEIPLYNPSEYTMNLMKVCWECRALLLRFHVFKLKVKTCYNELMQYLHDGRQESLPQPKPSSLQIHNIISIDCPGIKIEVDCLDIDEEHIPTFGPTLDEDIKAEDHLEMKTFANDFSIKDDEVEPSKESLKPPKEKKKKGKLKKNKTTNKKKKKSKKNSNLEVNSDESCYDGDIFLPFNEEHEEDYEKKVKDEELGKCDIEEENGLEEDCDIKKYADIEDGKQMKSNEAEVPVALPKPARARQPAGGGAAGGGAAGGGAAGGGAAGGGAAGGKPVCAECGKEFSSRKTLRYHLNVLHKGNNRYPCPKCGKVYQWKSNLGRHLRSHKARESGELYCAVCDKSFSSVATYRQHLAVSRQHVRESDFSFTCEECGKKFVNKVKLRDHVDWEHLRKIKFKCTLCNNKPFKCHTSLYLHMKNVHTEKGIRDNLCHVCGKSYQNRAKLRYHIVAMHTSQTPYRCAQCSAAFGWYSSLYRHVREVHHKIKLPPTGKKSRRAPPPAPPPHV